MNVLNEGHEYELSNVGEGSQTLNFVQKGRAADAAEDAPLEIIKDGTTNEEVITVLLNRMNFLHVALPDEFTQRAIDGLTGVLQVLTERTEDRKARGVEGTNNP